MIGNPSSTAHRHSGWSYEGSRGQNASVDTAWSVGRDLLQNSAVIPARLCLSLEAVAAHTEHSPVLLEDSKVGSVVLLVVAIRILSTCSLRQWRPLESGYGGLLTFVSIFSVSSMATAIFKELAPAAVTCFLRAPRPAIVYEPVC